MVATLFYEQTMYCKVHMLLPPASIASQRYDLRQCMHFLQLLEHLTQLSDCNFIIGQYACYIRTHISLDSTLYSLLFKTCWPAFCHALINEY